MTRDPPTTEELVEAIAPAEPGMAPPAEETLAEFARRYRRALSIPWGLFADPELETDVRPGNEFRIDEVLE